MKRIAPPAKGTLSTTAATVNQLQLPQLVAPVAVKPARVVARLYDKPARVIEQRPDANARAVVAPARAIAPPRDAAHAARWVASAVAKRARTIRPADDKIVRVVLIGCSKTKRPGRHPARALYQGALFKFALAHAQRIGADAFVVSAKHGLVRLDAELEAYEHKLRPMERTSWAYGVCLALRECMKGRLYAVTIFAGETYAEPLQRLMAALDPTVEVIAPLAGLSLGSQLRWFRVAAALAGGVQ